MNNQKPAFILGYGGLIPFIGLTACVWLLSGGAHEVALRTLMIWGALILSFLGGIHWGAALYKDPPHPYQLSLGILPSIVGLCALLVNHVLGLSILMIGFAAQWLVDRKLLNEDWFLKLRSALTIIVILCLAVAQLKLLI